MYNKLIHNIGPGVYWVNLKSNKAAGCDCIINESTPMVKLMHSLLSSGFVPEARFRTI